MQHCPAFNEICNRCQRTPRIVYALDLNLIILHPSVVALYGLPGSQRSICALEETSWTEAEKKDTPRDKMSVDFL
ncbi:hypothetical protein BDV29DRAFT_165466 [Aspergillus leporis]|jgi:hypothetical protein|uniref:Uncharacterized protein n=1 Tax=Aspergillus leporis TaxID=41062 RepID=A0A5N5XDM7_9EURO|nr:hypothetical protein BDV29DRAFT_165466 [Aspergillus leporis]